MPRAAVVDDYPIMRELLGEFLKRADFEVTGEAGTGAEVLAGYLNWRPDVLILDIMLPDVNGLELTKKIIALDPNAKILIISGLEEDMKLTQSCVEAGAKGFLAKPFSSEDLLRALRAL